MVCTWHTKKTYTTCWNLQWGWALTVSGCRTGKGLQICMRSSEELLCLTGHFPSEAECGQMRTGPRSADDSAPHGMAGNRWLARCRPIVTLKASEGKTCKNVWKTSDNQEYIRSGTYVFSSVLLLRCFDCRFVGVPVASMFNYGVITLTLNFLWCVSHERS